MGAGDSFSRFILYSLLIHIVLFGYFIFNPAGSFFPKKELYIKNAIRVNTVELSELKNQGVKQKKSRTKKKPVRKRPIKKKPVSKVKVKKRKIIKQKNPIKLKTKKSQAIDTKNQPKDIKQQQSQAIDKLQAMEQQQNQAIDKLQAMESIEKIKKEAEQFEPDSAVSNAGGTGQEVSFETLKYFTSLKAHINMYWSLPQELADRKLRAEIYTIINNDGRVLEGRIIKSSGNMDFDARVLETIEKASPLPSPPTKEIEKMLSEGVVFKFPE